MSKKQWTLPCVNNEAPFQLPEFDERDFQTTIDLLEIHVKAERRFKDLRPTAPMPTPPKKTGNKEHDEKILLKYAQAVPEDWRTYNQLLNMQVNLETSYYLLHKIDPRVTKDQVSKLGKTIRELVEDYFTEDADPQQAAKLTPLDGKTNEPPKNS